MDRVIDVCLCTFRRPSVVQTLQSLKFQQLPRGLTIRVVIADNDLAPTARERVEEAASALGLAYRYIHAPAQNISIARNACLDAIESDFAAFIDDDEIAAPDWLAQLTAWQAQTGCDIVFGPVRALYEQHAPEWAKRLDMHSFGATILRGGLIVTGYTSNVLFKTVIMRRERFDGALGRSGGEDTVLFHKLYLSGAQLGFCPDAWVSEPTAEGRLNMRWLLKRSFRYGQTHGTLLMLRGKNRLLSFVLSIAKASYCLLTAPFAVFGWRRVLMRGSLHLGAAARLGGLRDLTLY